MEETQERQYWIETKKKHSVSWYKSKTEKAKVNMGNKLKYQDEINRKRLVS